VSQTDGAPEIAPGRPLSCGLALSALGFGGAAIGGLFEAVDEDQAHRTVRRALDLGLRYLDTAPHYGRGISELRLGEALRGVPRDTYVISTKVGRLLRPLDPGESAPDEGYAQGLALKRVWDFSRDGVLRSVQESLERLGLDRIDIVYLHDPDDFEAQVYETGFPALAELRAQGTVRAIGAGMNQAAMLARFVRRLDFDVVLVAGRYTLLDQSALADLLPACLERQVGVVVGGAFQSGLLADPSPQAHYDYGPATPDLVRRALEMQAVCAAHGVSLPAAALQFPLGHPAVVSVLVGARSVAEVEQNAQAFTTPVPPQVWAQLRSAGLLAPDVPAP
jgi:D-threo-aldose 1-dehydrogenase